MRSATTMALAAAVLATALSLHATALEAHDFWIEPASFQPGTGQALTIDLKVGEVFIGDSVPRLSASIDRFVLLDADGAQRTISGSDGMVPAGIVEADAGRTTMILYDGGGGLTTLTGERFEAYLRAHGLEWVIEERARRGETGAAARERFHRHAKAVLRGAATSPVAATVVGQRLELVPQDDPSFPSSPMTAITIYWKGKPLGDCQVIARNQLDPSAALRARSDAEGRVRFQLPPGLWLLQAVWMQRGGWFSDADWESDWASLTFLKPSSAGGPAP